MTIIYSIIIPAYNEEQFLADTLDLLIVAMAATDLQGEIIVVDNNSDDNTGEIARNYGVKLVFEPVNQISRARNSGAKVAQGKYLIFLDADTTLSPELLQIALAKLESGKYCGGGVLVNSNVPLPKTVRRSLDLWNWVSVRFNLAAGCFIYCLREGFEAIGGFSEKVYISEEIWFSNKLRRWGKKLKLKFHIISSPHIITSMRKLDWYSPWEMILVSVPILLFPPAVRFRTMCFPWYRRPNKSK